MPKMIPKKKDVDKSSENSNVPKMRKPKFPKFTRYTPLDVDQGRILEEALNTKLLQTPEKVSTPPNADTKKQFR